MRALYVREYERRAPGVFFHHQARTKYIDALLARDEFLDIWVMKWAEMLQIRTVNGLSPKGLQRYDAWLRDRVRSGVTIDRIALELLPATGGTFENPAVNYYQTETTPQLIAENVAQVFLGTRIQCAQCHHHPSDRWGQEDYFALAGFFTSVQRKPLPGGGEAIFAKKGNDLPHPRTAKLVAAHALGAEPADFAKHVDSRVVLANWLTATDNPFFARAAVNRLWSHYFSRGLVEPLDDMRATNPASNKMRSEISSALKTTSVTQREPSPKVSEKLFSRTIRLSFRSSTRIINSSRSCEVMRPSAIRSWALRPTSASSSVKASA